MSSDFMCIQASPHNSQIAIIGYGTAMPNGLFISTDGGQNYIQVLNIFNTYGADINFLCFNPNPAYENQVVIGGDQGLYRTNNVLAEPIIFYPLNKTLSLTQAYRVASDPGNAYNISIAKTDGGALKRYNNGSNFWVATGIGCDATNVVFSKYTPNIMLGSRGPGGQCGIFGGYNMYRSTDGGDNWYNNQFDLDGYWDGDQDWIAILTQYPNPNTPNTFFHARRDAGTEEDHKKINIYVTTNNGLNWISDP